MSGANMPSQSAPTSTDSQDYVEVLINNQNYLVPILFVEIVQLQAAQAASLGQKNAEVRVTPSSAPAHPNVYVAENKIPIPPQPPIVEREAQMLHEKVQAMCIQDGLSYKDAAHHLYLMEMAALDAHHEAMDAFNEIYENIRTAVHNEIVNPIFTLDSMYPRQVNVQPGGTLELDVRLHKK